MPSAGKGAFDEPALECIDFETFESLLSVSIPVQQLRVMPDRVSYGIDSGLSATADNWHEYLHPSTTISLFGVS